MLWFFRYFRGSEEDGKLRKKWIMEAVNRQKANEEMREDAEKWDQTCMLLHGPFDTEQQAQETEY